MKNNRRIPFFDYPRLFTDDEEKILSIFQDVGRRGAFILQQDLKDFEIELSKFVGSKFSIGVANATDGLELAWLTVGLKPGDEVIISSHTMLATASAIITAGGVPVPVDIGDDNLIDPLAIEAAINKRTVGISPTQLNGRTCNMDLIMQIAEKHGLAVVEDAAQALGSKFKNRHAGTFGIAGCISFFPAKVLGCFGDGGAVITNDGTVFDKVFQLHDHGRDSEGNVKGWGRNSRLDNLQAAFLHAKLMNYEDVIKQRRRLASLYEEGLKGLEQLKLPPGPNHSSEHFDVYQNYELVAEQRDELRDYLALHGIGTLVQWGGKAVHQWDSLGFRVSLPKVEQFFKGCLMLPMNLFITQHEVNYICHHIREFYTK